MLTTPSRKLLFCGMLEVLALLPPARRRSCRAWSAVSIGLVIPSGNACYRLASVSAPWFRGSTLWSWPRWITLLLLLLFQSMGKLCTSMVSRPITSIDALVLVQGSTLPGVECSLICGMTFPRRNSFCRTSQSGANVLGAMLAWRGELYAESAIMEEWMEGSPVFLEKHRIHRRGLSPRAVV